MLPSPVRVLVLNDHQPSSTDHATGMVDSLYVLVTLPLEETGWASWSMCWTTAYEQETGEDWGPWVCQWIDRWCPHAVITPALAWGTPRVDEGWAQVSAQTRRLGIPLLVWWTDLVTEGDILLAESLLGMIEYHVAIDRRTPPRFAADPSRYLCLWTPQPERWFYRDARSRTLSLSFIGERFDRPERARILRAVEEAQLPLTVAGGRREQDHPLPWDTYAKMVRGSHRVLNITSHPTCPCVKGRTFEALASGALLIDQDTSALRRYMTPGADCLVYRDEHDVVPVIQYALSHEAESERIAWQGHQTYRAQFTSAHFWNQVFGVLWGPAWQWQRR